MVQMQPKMKRKYKTKKEKEKYVTFEELTAIGKPMVEGDMFEEETQSLKDLMEEEIAMTPLHKNIKKKGKDGVGPNKASTQEKTPSPIAQKKGGTETSVSSLVKKPLLDPKKSKGKEKIPHFT